MGERGRRKKRPDPKSKENRQSNLEILEEMQAELLVAFRQVVGRVKSTNPKTAKAGLVRLAPVSEQLRSVTRDHARLLREDGQRPPKGFVIEVKRGTSDAERDAMRQLMEQAIREAGDTTVGPVDADQDAETPDGPSPDRGYVQ
jgi:hypothetical protein